MYMYKQNKKYRYNSIFTSYSNKSKIKLAVCQIISYGAHGNKQGCPLHAKLK